MCGIILYLTANNIVNKNYISSDIQNKKMFDYNTRDIDDTIYNEFEVAPIAPKRVHFGAGERKRRAPKVINVDDAAALINYYFAALMI